MHSLPLFIRLKDARVLLAGNGEAVDAKRRLLERAGACISSVLDVAALEAVLAAPDCPAFRLAIVVTDDEQEAATIADLLKARNILTNVTDRPALCEFTLPAIIDRDPVLIAIGTGGTSAGLAKMLRQRLELLLPPNLGRLAEALYAARASLKAKWPSPSERRRALDSTLAEGGTLDCMVMQTDDAVEQWVASSTEKPRRSLYTIRLTSADPDDLTLRDARMLGTCDLLVHRADVPAAILDRSRADATRMIANTPPAEHEGICVDIGWA